MSLFKKTEGANVTICVLLWCQFDWLNGIRNDSDSLIW